jgi:LytS/YehU family sensor histidine kinase
MKSYIELQLLKDDGMKNVTYDFDDADPGLRVAPLIFITFLENSFKHSHVEDTANAWIKASVTSSGNRIRFAISNSIPESPPATDKAAGIGLENVKRRLQLLYPGRHRLTITEEKNKYKVELEIESKKDED